MSEFTHIVRFVEVTPHEVRLQASTDTEALGIAKRLAETLSPTGRAKTFITSDTVYERFEAEPLLKPFTVTVEAKAIYEITIEARDRTDAEEKAEDEWNSCGPDNFSFEDFEDTRFHAEEEEP